MTEPNRDHQLQEYFDGELSLEDAEALRLEIEADEELQAKLEGLSHLRVLIRGALAPEHLEIPSGDAMFSAIEAQLGEPEAEESADADVQAAPALRVVDGGKSSKTEPETKPDAKPPVWIGVVGLTLAAAAALWFFVLRPGDTGTVPGGDDPTGPIAALQPPPGSEIEQIDLGHSTGAIFQVEDEGARYAVVWIGDEKPSDLMPSALDTNVVDPDEERIQ